MSKLFVCLLALSACVTRSDLEAIEKTQAQILAKVDQLAQGRAGSQPARAQGPNPADTYAVPLGDSARKGSDDAWVTIVAISDFQCPFCKRVTDTLEQIEKSYGDDVRVVFKHNPLPFHNRAKPAALAAECASEQGKFWAMHDLLFADQKALDDAGLEASAKKVGVDVGTWKSCYAGAKPTARLDADQRLATGFGANGTPAFFINGRFLNGAQPIERFKAVIDEELQKAKASGIARSQYYAKAVVEKGKKAL